MEIIGSVIGNRYEILEHIGTGGMAMVYKAKCRLLNRFVAIKILKPEFNEDAEFLRRFSTEAQAAASLSHTNIVSIHDVGKQGNLNYIVMEYVEGITLKEYMKNKGRLNLNEALDFSMQIALALEHAHSKRIIHRDIKPQNIVLDNTGTLKVTDFGLAKAISSATVVAEGASALGSVHYASPEQARGGHTDERSDIYSLGIVMYEMFSGKLPYTGDSAIAIAMKHIQEVPQKPRMINDNIPVEIEEIILRAIAKYSHERFESISEIISNLRSVGHNAFKKAPQVTLSDGEIFSTKRLPEIHKETLEEKTIQKKQNKKFYIDKEKMPQVAALVVASILIVLTGFVVARMFFSGSGGKGSIEVPQLIGMDYEKMTLKYQDKLEIIENQRINDADYPEGTIISQEPKEGEKISEGGVINVVVSLGAKTFELDDYTGEDYRRVENDIKKLDMNIKIEVVEEEDEEVEAGKIIKQKPAKGKVLEEGDKITLYVSKGVDTKEINMPKITGKTEQEARSILADNELLVGKITYTESTEKEGTVISQGVSEGDKVYTKTEIDLIVSAGASNQKTTRQISLSLPSGKETVNVKITDNSGNILYQQAHSTENTPIVVSVSGSGKQVLEIYYDNVLYNSITVNFN